MLIKSKFLKNIVILSAVSLACANQSLYATSEQTMQTKAQLEARLNEASDFSHYDGKVVVAAAWRLAEIQMDETVSRSGNKLLFSKEQAYTLALFSYRTSNNLSDNIPLDDQAGAMYSLTRWHMLFNDTSEKFQQVKSLCLEFFQLGLDPNSQVYNNMDLMYKLALEKLGE